MSQLRHRRVRCRDGTTWPDTDYYAMKKPNDRKRPNSHSCNMGRFVLQNAKFLHLSKPLMDHPDWDNARRRGVLQTYIGPRWILGIGRTLNAKRNAMKRKRRALMISIAGSMRAYRRAKSSAGRGSVHYAVSGSPAQA